MPTILDAFSDAACYIGAGSVAKLVHNCAGYGIQMVLAESSRWEVEPLAHGARHLLGGGEASGLLDDRQATARPASKNNRKHLGTTAKSSPSRSSSAGARSDQLAGRRQSGRFWQTCRGKNVHGKTAHLPPR